MLRGAALVSVAGLLLGCACNRAEEPVTASRGDDTTSASPASAGPSPSSVSPTPLSPSASAVPPPVCTVPLGAPAPIASKPAQCPKDPTGNFSLPAGRVTFVDAPGKPAVDVELARDNPSRERGLMYRTRMAENQGMLFSWPDERVRSFWMRNTCLPLDMLFITRDGTISGILEQVPTLNEAPRKLDCPVAHVLELNAGWSRSHGIMPGMKVAIDG
jgi:uncharacterized membrane protein (UPF0127 family)